MGRKRLDEHDKKETKTIRISKRLWEQIDKEVENHPEIKTRNALIELILNKFFKNS